MAEWINVKDRLPEKDEVVIALIIGSDFIIQEEGETLADAIARARKHKRVTLAYLDDDGWYGSDGFPEIIAPSYWMPLPEPPKEDEEEIRSMTRKNYCDQLSALGYNPDGTQKDE